MPGTFTINQYQFYNSFNYSDGTPNLYINNQPDNIGFNYNGATYDLQVDRYMVAATYTYDVYDSSNMPYDTITIIVTPLAPSITHNGNLGDINMFASTLPPAPISNWQISGNYSPQWFFFAFSGYIVPAIDRVGTFYVLFEDEADPLNNVYLVKFNFSSNLQEYEFCSPYEKLVVWLNPSGGWSSYCFKGKKTFGYDVGNKNIFRNADGIQKYYNIEDVFKKLDVLSGEIPISHSEFIKSLKYAVQVYLLESIYVPVIIEDGDFILYQEGDGLMKYDITLRYANVIPVQTQ